MTDLANMGSMDAVVEYKGMTKPEVSSITTQTFRFKYDQDAVESLVRIDAYNMLRSQGVPVHPANLKVDELSDGGYTVRHEVTKKDDENDA